MSENDAEGSLVDSMWDALDDNGDRPPLEFAGAGTLTSAFAVSELVTASVATAGLAAARLLEAVGAASGTVVVDRALSCAWCAFAVSPVGWQLPSPWDPLAGDYPSADGWIRLHTNAPHHRDAALFELGVAPDRAQVAAAVRTWRGEDLELAIVSAGGCAAVMRTRDEWAAHPQGIAVANERLIAWGDGDVAVGSSDWTPTLERPLAGLKVLDLTRVVAGPVATRFLAGLGADVLRVDPPEWDEPGVVPDMTLGKRSARLNAHIPADFARLRALIADADVVVHGFRADALDRLGLGEAALQELRPGLIDVAITAYGWTGAWRTRRGFDSLVQMSTGIADEGMRRASADVPTPLPVQALDHVTGYLAAAATLAGLRRRTLDRVGSTARLSLARTALELVSAGAGGAAQPAPEFERKAVETPWGPAQLLASPVTLAGVPLEWALAPRDLGTDDPSW